MKDEPAYMDEDIVSMPYAPEDDADGHGKLQSEEFLGRRLGVLVGVPVQENIVPLQEGMTFIRRSRWAIRLSMKMSG